MENNMSASPQKSKQLALVIDLNVCV
ncbi:MAG: hypothetical protein RI941_632, partial [Pseudomonadota bacterium]